MKTFRNVLRMIGVIAAILLGGIPLMIGVASGLLFRTAWIAYTIGLIFIFGMTILSWINPEMFRFGEINLNLHSPIRIGGYSPLLLNLGYNFGFVFLGVLSGLTAKNGYYRARG
jgi:hypothetical protein